jgi:hypothetical protein
VCASVGQEEAAAAGSWRSDVGMSDKPMKAWCVGACLDWPRYALKISISKRADRVLATCRELELENKDLLQILF